MIVKTIKSQKNRQEKTTKIKKRKICMRDDAPTPFPALSRLKSRRYQLIEDYKALDLKLYVIRQAHISNINKNEELCEKEAQVNKIQSALLIELKKAEIQSLDDVLLCFQVWFMETIKNKRSWELTSVEQMMKNVFIYLREHRDGILD